MRRLFVVVLCAGLAGCGRGAGPATAPQARLGNGPSSENPFALPPALQLTPPLAPKPLPQLERELAARDPADRNQAAADLRERGEDGFLPILRGMQSSSAETRLISLQVLSPDLIARHPLETMPVLEALLGETNPKARALAATRLGFLGKTGMNAVPVLRRLSTDDPDPDVRKSAALSLLAIQNAGKMTSR